jgi:hypothetical protein
MYAAFMASWKGTWEIFEHDGQTAQASQAHTVKKSFLSYRAFYYRVEFSFMSLINRQQQKKSH